MALAVAAGLVVVMFEFQEWPMWIWMLSIFGALVIALWAGWVDKRGQKADGPTREIVPQLSDRPYDPEAERRRQWFNFIDRNMMWFYLIIVLAIVPLIRECMAS